jgi:hypothetical protein
MSIFFNSSKEKNTLLTSFYYYKTIIKMIKSLKLLLVHVIGI